MDTKEHRRGWLGRPVLAAALALALPLGAALLAGPALAGTGGTSTTPPFNECPAVGHDTSCGILLVIEPDGTVKLLTDPSQHAYDGIDDTLVGVLNKSRFLVTSLPLTSTSGAFGFDGDGICAASISPKAPGCPFSTTRTGYEGPDNTFTVLNPDHGTVNFVNGALKPGTSTFFGLEGNVTPLSLEFPIVAQAVAVHAVEGQAFSGTVATFIDPDASDPADSAAKYAATIQWGDGTSSAGTVTALGGGKYSVSGSHVYADEGTPKVAVRITDPDDPGQATASATATVHDAALTATGSPAFASANPVSGRLATFTDANPGATVLDFTTGGGSTTMQWGDGTTSPGVVTKTGTGQFAVSGTHTYAVLGPHTIVISIIDDGGSTATATTRVIVFAFAHGGSFVIGNRNSAIGTAVTFWGARWAKMNSLSGGPAPASFKGFEGSVADPACGSKWTARPGNSAHPPNGPLPSFMGVIVTSSITKHGSKISGNTLHIVVVKTNPGYKPNPGHAGTGTVEALVC